MKPTRILRASLLAVLPTLLVFGGSVRAQIAGRITVFADPGATSCSLTDEEPGLFTVYVMHTNALVGVYSFKFRVVESSGFHAIFLNEAVSSPTYFGSLRAGIDIAYGSCSTASRLLGTIMYEGQGTSDACSYIDIVANLNPPGLVPFPAVQSCSFELYEAPPIGRLYVNPTMGQCDSACGVAVGVEASTWGSVKSLYR